MNEYPAGTLAYFEFTNTTKVRGCKVENLIKGHYLVIQEEKNYVMLKEEEIEFIVRKKDIREYKPVTN
jgi:hypothetical protein